MNKEKKTVKEILREKGVSVAGVGRVIGRSYRCTLYKLNGETPFNTDEITKLCQAYNLSRSIFFDSVVPQTEQKGQ